MCSKVNGFTLIERYIIHFLLQRFLYVMEHICVFIIYKIMIVRLFYIYLP